MTATVRFWPEKCSEPVLIYHPTGGLMKWTGSFVDDFYVTVDDGLTWFRVDRDSYKEATMSDLEAWQNLEQLVLAYPEYPEDM